MNIPDLDNNIERIANLYTKEKKEVWRDFLRDKISVCLRNKHDNQLELFPYYNVPFDIMDEYVLNSLEEKYWRKNEQRQDT